MTRVEPDGYHSGTQEIESEAMTRDEQTRLIPRGIPLLLFLALGCGGSGERVDLAGGADGYRGFMLEEPRPKPDFTLTDTEGRAFAFREQTDGYLALVFFGYTYCPDICPLHMANLGAVMTQFPPSVSGRIKVVFVSTDPARDTPERVRKWLDNFHRDFIGLTGTLDRVNEIQVSMGLQPSQLGTPDSVSGAYLVGHAAFVVAFTPDNLERAFYPFGIRQADWAHDLPKLLGEEWEGS